MTLYNNFLLKRGVGLFSRVGLILGDYGTRPTVCIVPYSVYARSLHMSGRFPGILDVVSFLISFSRIF